MNIPYNCQCIFAALRKPHRSWFHMNLTEIVHEHLFHIFFNIYLTKLVTWISHFQMRGRHESQVSSTTFWRKFLGNLKTQNFNRILFQLLLANFFVCWGELSRTILSAQNLRFMLSHESHIFDQHESQEKIYGWTREVKIWDSCENQDLCGFPRAANMHWSDMCWNFIYFKFII